MTYRKKLIEVALPLDAINAESAREKSIRHGHPSTLHLWWARRPLAACRAVLFASLVDDPSSLPELFPTEEAQQRERKRLHELIEELVLWDNVNNEAVLHPARTEIARSCARAAGVTLPDGDLTPEQVRDVLDKYAPPVLDPFAGGGSIPLEAQRLGLKAYASDLNPVAVLINKALIEIPPRFAGRPPVNPEARRQMPVGGWRGAAGLAEDVRYYGKWMRDEAERRIGHLYPRVKLPKEYGGGEATVIAWLWARTVKCPNPACGARMPLLRSFALSSKKGKEYWLEPRIDRKKRVVHFEVHKGGGTIPQPTKQRGKSRCLLCGTENISDATLRDQARLYGLDPVGLALVVEETGGRIYLPFDSRTVPALPEADTDWLRQPLPDNPRWFSPPGYGLPTYQDLFTARQLVALSLFGDLIGAAREQVCRDAILCNLPDDRQPLGEGGLGAQAYADAISVYLAFGLDKNTLTNCAQATWQSNPDRLTQAFARQAIPMTWDYAEANPLSKAGGGYVLTVQSLGEVLGRLPSEGSVPGAVQQLDASASVMIQPVCISTDPPYYDNIGYADLSDFFYVWLRCSLAKVYPAVFSTLLVPKTQELVAAPSRFDGSKERAQAHFEHGLGRAFDQMRAAQVPDYPMAIYYAFKQSEADADNEEDEGARAAVASTGWETMLEGLIRAGFAVNGTWPMRTELIGSLKKNIGALASSIVLVCRPRPDTAPLATRREFLNALKRELPDALAVNSRLNWATRIRPNWATENPLVRIDLP